MDSLKLLRKQFVPGFDSRHLHQIGQCVIDLPGLINDRPGNFKGMTGFDRLQVRLAENPERLNGKLINMFPQQMKAAA